MKPTKSSIAKITEQFINNLQKDYPSTTYTIGKIANKLQNQNDVKKRCFFCKVSQINHIQNETINFNY
jgi:hypothetical protein